MPAPPTTETPGRLVPDADPVDVLVCRYGDLAGSDSAGLEADGAGRAGRLAARPARDPARHGPCDGVPTSSSHLVLSYADGPPVELRWTPGCEPSLGNGSLSAVPTPAPTELLQLLLG